MSLGYSSSSSSSLTTACAAVRCDHTHVVDFARAVVQLNTVAQRKSFHQLKIESRQIASSKSNECVGEFGPGTSNRRGMARRVVLLAGIEFDRP